MNIHSNSGRLSFVEYVKSSFAYLENYGYTVKENTDTMVLYVSSDVSVKVYHGRLSYQLGMEIKQTDSEEYYNLFEILSTFAAEHARMHRQYSTEAELRESVAQLATIIHDCCEDIISGQVNAFRRLSEHARMQRAQVTKDAQYGAIMDQADLFWEAKDYERAFVRYKQAEPNLDSTRMRRLKYLQDHGYNDKL